MCANVRKCKEFVGNSRNAAAFGEVPDVDENDTVPGVVLVEPVTVAETVVVEVLDGDELPFPRIANHTITKMMAMIRMMIPIIARMVSTLFFW